MGFPFIIFIEFIAKFLLNLALLPIFDYNIAKNRLPVLSNHDSALKNMRRVIKQWLPAINHMFKIDFMS